MTSSRQSVSGQTARNKLHEGLVGGPVLTETSAAELDLWHLLHRLPELAGEPAVPEHLRHVRWFGDALENMVLLATSFSRTGLVVGH